jgi:hypothetical protein
MNNENLTFFNLNHHFCRHRNDGLYDFVLFVQYAKQEIPQRAVKQRKFWRFNVVVVYCNLLFLLLFGTFWYTLRRSRTPTCNQKFARIVEEEKKKRNFYNSMQTSKTVREDPNFILRSQFYIHGI